MANTRRRVSLALTTADQASFDVFQKAGGFSAAATLRVTLYLAAEQLQSKRCGSPAYCSVLNKIVIKMF